MKSCNLILWAIYILLGIICTFLMKIIFLLHKTSVEFPEKKESSFYFIRMNDLVSHLKLATYGVCSMFHNTRALT